MSRLYVVENASGLEDEHGYDERVAFVGDVPHDLLFPRAAAVVHHGGAGTTTTGRPAVATSLRTTLLPSRDRARPDLAEPTTISLAFRWSAIRASTSAGRPSSNAVSTPVAARAAMARVAHALARAAAQFGCE